MINFFVFLTVFVWTVVIIWFVHDVSKEAPRAEDYIEEMDKWLP